MPLADTPSLPITTSIWPDALREREQWLTWKRTDDDPPRKIPRAPFVHRDHLDRYVNAHDPANQTDFETAREWAEMLPGHNLAYDIRSRDNPPGEDLVLLDYDDVRDPETGTIHATVREHIDRVGSYAAVSSSGTGVHILGLLPAGFPDGVKAIDSPLDLPPAAADDDDDASEDFVEEESTTAFPTAELEGYDQKRFVGLTGKHLTDSPTELADLTAFIADLCETYATAADGSPDPQREPDLSREEVADVEHTDAIQDVFDAIEHTHPRDIRLRSTVTNERHNSKDLDPSWGRSASGTRLAQLNDGWVYRKGMHGLDALQLVALEEGLIARESVYPEGETFWRAVDALRDRGAHIPHYVSSEELVALTSTDDSDATGGAASTSDDPPSDTDTGDVSPPDDVVVALGGELAFKSLRSNYTRRCPDCASSVDDTHETACTLNSVPMMTINTAYETIIAQLKTTTATRSRLQRKATGWSPVHRAVFDYLWECELLVPAGSEGSP
jgi:putative DNA primase/helicase